MTEEGEREVVRDVRLAGPWRGSVGADMRRKGK